MVHIDKKELAAARNRRLQRSSRRATSAPVLSRRNMILLSAMVLILVVLGFVLDAQRLKKMGVTGRTGMTVKQDLQNLVLGLTQPPYVDERAGFSIVPPAGWRPVEYADTGEYDAIWTGPLQTDLRVQVAEKPYSDFERLRREIVQIERNFGGTQHLQDIEIAGRPGVRRHGKLQGSSFLSVDFMDGHRAFHILCSVPREQFEAYEPVLMDLMMTVNPNP